MPDQRDIDDVEHSRIAAVLVLALVFGDFLGRSRTDGPDPGTGSSIQNFPPGHATARHLLGVGEADYAFYDRHLRLLLLVEQAIGEEER
jgi:hypothetical protein